MLASPRRFQTIWRWGLLGGYAACIFLLSSMPGQTLPKVHVNDKLIHTGEFALLGFLMCRALASQMPTWPRPRIACLSLLVAIVYGATDEFHQLFVAARSAEWADLAADSVGAALAVWIWLKAGGYWTWIQ
jgi:VanZ family protein